VTILREREREVGGSMMWAMIVSAKKRQIREIRKEK
jgi:hypothetical protein